MAGMSSTVALSSVRLLSGGEVELRIVAMMTEGQMIQTIECLASRLFRNVGCGSLLRRILSLAYVVSQNYPAERQLYTPFFPGDNIVLKINEIRHKLRSQSVRHVYFDGTEYQSVTVQNHAGGSASFPDDQRP